MADSLSNFDEGKRTRRALLFGSNPAAVIVIIFLSVVGVWIGVTLLIYWLRNYSTQDAAQTADMFGAVNALFSALAFAGVILAILLQRQELQLQRDELTLTRVELNRTASAQEQSQEALARQAESLLLAAYISAVNSLQDANASEPVKDMSRRAEYLTVLRTIVQELEPRIEYLSRRNTAAESAFRISSQVQSKVYAIREKLLRLQITTDHFGRDGWSVLEIQGKVRELKQAIEDAFATPDKSVRDALQVHQLDFTIDLMHQILTYSRMSDQIQDHFEFHSHSTTLVSIVDSWRPINSV